MSTLPRRASHLMTGKGLVPVYTTAVVEQPWASYSDSDHAVWGQLFRRQQRLLADRADDEFLNATAALRMDDRAIPKFTELNVALGRRSGWQIIGVEGLLPDLVFFEHLAERRFPVTWWIREQSQLDYISEPDLFHDLFGHVPLLMNPMFANYMQAYGAGGVRAHGFGAEALAQLTRLYWYTVEFGLIASAGGLRIYGSGILSSAGESIHALDSAAPNHIAFDLERVMRTRYRIDSFQKTYFVIESYRQLMTATSADFGPIYQRLAGLPAIPASATQGGDQVLQHGSGAGWQADGDV